MVALDAPDAPYVLVIDDDEHFVRLLALALEQRGARCEGTASSFGIVNRLAHGGNDDVPRPDVLVLDCGLPALSGPTVLGLILKNERASRIPVMMVSAATPQNLPERLALHPRASFMLKDGRFGRLADAILALAQSPPTA
jgi:CheY-like chemotaxis protein